MKKRRNKKKRNKFCFGRLQIGDVVSFEADNDSLYELTVTGTGREQKSGLPLLEVWLVERNKITLKQLWEGRVIFFHHITITSGQDVLLAVNDDKRKYILGIHSLKVGGVLQF